MISLLLAILGFGLLIFIHELGHFLIAKLFKVKVERFSIGMGPALVGFRRGDTFYQIGAFPFGGFCQFKEDALQDDLPIVLTEEKYRMIMDSIKEEKEKEEVSASYQKEIPNQLTKSEYEEVVSSEGEALDKETFLACYDFSKEKNCYLRKEELSEKDLYVSAEYLENMGREWFEYRVKESVFHNVQQKNRISNLLYRFVDIKKLRDPDSFFGVAPLKRLLIALAGPLMNYLLAIVLFAFIFMGTQTEVVIPNKILLTDDVMGGSRETLSPAKRAGLRSGDKIIAINGNLVGSFQELSEQMILVSGKDEIRVTVEREGRSFDCDLVPEWDKDNLKPVLGVYYYLEPVIHYQEENPLLTLLGLEDQDRIVSVEGEEQLVSSITVEHYLSENYGKERIGYLVIERDGTHLQIDLDFKQLSEEIEKRQFGLSYQFETRKKEGMSLPFALGKGIQESNKLVRMTAVGLQSLLFRPKGNVAEQVGGPIKIGYLMKNITEAGFTQGVLEGFRSLGMVIANISLALAFCNLLPFPALDGGYIVISLIETITRRPFKMKYIYLLNLIGFVILITLAIWIAFMDIRYIVRK